MKLPFPQKIILLQGLLSIKTSASLPILFLALHADIRKNVLSI